MAKWLSEMIQMMSALISVSSLSLPTKIASVGRYYKPADYLTAASCKKMINQNVQKEWQKLDNRKKKFFSRVAHSTKCKKINTKQSTKTMSISNNEYNIWDTSYRCIIKEKNAKKN